MFSLPFIASLAFFLSPPPLDSLLLLPAKMEMGKGREAGNEMRTKGGKKGWKKEAVADPFLCPSTGGVSSVGRRRRRLKQKGAKRGFFPSSSLGLPSFSRSFCGDPYCKQKKRSRPSLKPRSAGEKKRKTFPFPSFAAAHEK